LAFTKQHKTVMVTDYENWIGKSQAIFILEYSKMNQKAIDAARTKLREAGGEFHVVKNTLFRRALKKYGMSCPESMLEGNTIIGFAFTDPPALAKAFTELTRNNEMFKVRAGFLGDQYINAAAVKALAELPPLPVMRAQLLGVLSAPASQLVRVLAEPARSLAAVVKAHSEKSGAAEAAPAA